MLDEIKRLRVSYSLLLTVVVYGFSADAAATALHASVRQADYSTRIGEPLQVIAEMTAEKDLMGCTVQLAKPAPLGLGYQFTDGQGGPRLGVANTPTDLKALTPQALLLIITPQVLLDEVQIELVFACADGIRAENIPARNTLLLTVNAPYLENDLATPGARWRAQYESASPNQECRPWPIEHVYLHFDNTLLVRVMAARMDDSKPVAFPSLGTVTLDYEVEEELRGSAQAISAISGPLTAIGNRPNTVIPLGSRFIVSGDRGAIRWEQCSLYWMVPADDNNDCQLYRYRRLASDAAPYDERCEVASIVDYLGRLNVASNTPQGVHRLNALKRIWHNATGHRWDGKSVPNDILYRMPHEQTADFSSHTPGGIQ